MKKILTLVIISICMLSQGVLAQEESSEVQRAEQEMAEAAAKLQLLKSKKATQEVDIGKLKELLKEKKIAEEAYTDEVERSTVLTLVILSGATSAMMGVGMMLPLTLDLSIQKESSLGGLSAFLVGGGALCVGSSITLGGLLFESMFFNIEKRKERLDEKSTALDEAIMAY